MLFQQRWNYGNVFMTALPFGSNTTMYISILLGYVEELEICTGEYLN